MLVRSGCFRRRVDGRDSVLDPAVLYVQAPGEEQQVALPRAGGDACTVVRVEPRYSTQPSATTDPNVARNRTYEGDIQYFRPEEIDPRRNMKIGTPASPY